MHRQCETGAQAHVRSRFDSKHFVQTKTLMFEILFE